MHNRIMIKMLHYLNYLVKVHEFTDVYVCQASTILLIVLRESVAGFVSLCYGFAKSMKTFAYKYHCMHHF